MDRTAFRELLWRYANDTATPEEKVLVDHWYELLYNNNIPALKQEELIDIEQEMWTYIEKEGIAAEEEALVVSVNRSKRRRLYAISAASVVIALALTTWVQFHGSAKTFSYQQSLKQNQLLESINNTSAAQRVLLSDSSYVILQPASKIAYSKFNAASREVYLEGEAFFQVTKDASRPFYVYTNELVTKVLGTSFDVRAFPNDNTIKVLVHTGKVTVYKRKPNEHDQQLAKLDATILKQNQQVLFNRQQLNMVRSIAAQPQTISTNYNRNNGVLWFSDAPASEVFTAIEKAYGISIIYDEELMSRCSFTGAFTSETFFERISLVCKAIEATFEQADGVVLIYGHDYEK